MKIIGISGKKQAGKNTVANYINGHVLKSRNMVSDFYIDDQGKLIVQTTDSSGKLGYGEFDVTRKDKAFVEYANIELWPYIKVYHFADPLKEMAINLFGLDPKNIYGSDDDKNEKTNFLWRDMPDTHVSEENCERLTHREFLEYFGTKIIRKIKNNAWSQFSIDRILSEQSEIAIIPDVRFPNEVDVIQNAGGKVIRLTRDIFSSLSEPETALDQDRFDWQKFDVVVDNKDMSLPDLCQFLESNNWIWG